MSTAANLPADRLALLADTDTQRLAARLAQDVFAQVFRLSADADAETTPKALGELETRCSNWCRAGGEAGHALRTALLIAGLDQWGLAYSQAFNLTAIPALSGLIGKLRNGLNTQTEAQFQAYFGQIAANEGDAVDFKIELRRGIHLALWHAMAACESMEQAQLVLRPLGGMMLALARELPELGWRLLADALAAIQVCLLENPEIGAVGRDATQQLFESLRQALPPESYRNTMAHAAQAIMAWQQARRSAAH